MSAIASRQPSQPSPRRAFPFQYTLVPRPFRPALSVAPSLSIRHVFILHLFIDFFLFLIFHPSPFNFFSVSTHGEATPLLAPSPNAQHQPPTRRRVLLPLVSVDRAPSSLSSRALANRLHRLVILTSSALLHFALCTIFIILYLSWHSPLLLATRRRPAPPPSRLPLSHRYLCSSSCNDLLRSGHRYSLQPTVNSLERIGALLSRTQNTNTSHRHNHRQHGRRGAPARARPVGEEAAL